MSVFLLYASTQIDELSCEFPKINDPEPENLIKNEFVIASFIYDDPGPFFVTGISSPEGNRHSDGSHFHP